MTDDLERIMDRQRFDPDQIRKRLPSTMTDSEERATVCVVRNPDGDVPEIAATAGVDESTVFSALGEWVKHSDPITDGLATVHLAALDVILDDYDGDAPDADGPDVDDLARAAGRRASESTNRTFVRSLLHRDDIDALVVSRHVENSLDDGGNATGIAREIVHDRGFRPLLGALGEAPPDGNLDRLDEPDPGPQRDEFAHLPDRADKSDVEPGKDYYARVNGVEPWGVFVHLNSPRYGDEVNGLVHKSKLPPMVRAEDFTKGDEVGVRLAVRKPDGDLEFCIVAAIDTLRNQDERWEPTHDFEDRTTDAIPAAGGGADAGGDPPESDDDDDDDDDEDGPADPIPVGDPEPVEIETDTDTFRVLVALVEEEASPENALSTADVKSLDCVSTQSNVSGYLGNLFERGLADRQEREGASRKRYEYWPTEVGVATAEAHADAPDEIIESIEGEIEEAVESRDDVEPEYVEADPIEPVDPRERGAYGDAIKNHGEWRGEQLHCRHCGKHIPSRTSAGLAGHLGHCQERGGRSTEPPNPSTGGFKAGEHEPVEQTDDGQWRCLVGVGGEPCGRMFDSLAGARGHRNAHAGTDDDPDAFTPSPTGEEPESEPAAEPADEPEPEPDEEVSDVGDDDQMSRDEYREKADAAVRDGFKSDLLMRVGMIRGKHDLPPEEAAEVLREVAETVERGGL